MNSHPRMNTSGWLPRTPNGPQLAQLVGDMIYPDYLLIYLLLPRQM